MITLQEAFERVHLERRVMVAALEKFDYEYETEDHSIDYYVPVDRTVDYDEEDHPYPSISIDSRDMEWQHRDRRGDVLGADFGAESLVEYLKELPTDTNEDDDDEESDSTDV